MAHLAKDILPHAGRLAALAVLGGMLAGCVVAPAPGYGAYYAPAPAVAVVAPPVVVGGWGWGWRRWR